jgi:hypothetical protein
MALDGAGFFTTVKAIVTYSFQSLFFALSYFVSLQWLTQFIEFPATVKHHYILILDGKNVLHEMLMPDTSLPIFGESKLHSKNLFTGILNSFFLALPLSVPHFISVRALFINGVPRGAYYALGTITGQSMVILPLLYGWDFRVAARFGHPVSLLIGFIVLCRILLELCRDTDLLPVTIDEKRKLWKSYRQNVMLASFDTYCIHHYFGSLSVHGGLLETSQGSSAYLLSTFTYWVGLVLGSLFFSILFGACLLRIRDFMLNRIFRVPWGVFLERCHYFVACVICTFALHSVPYYGFDYLMSNPLGLMYQDILTASFQGQPRTFLYEPDPKPQEEPEQDGDILVDGAPFDDMPLTYQPGFMEDYSLDAERNWLNRELMRDMEEQVDSNRPGPSWRQFDPTAYVQMYYDSPELQEEDIAELDVKYGLMNDLGAAVFRDDVYEHRFSFDPKNENYDMQMFEVIRKFRDRTYSNPVYKALIRADMLTFLAGQPTSNLSTQDEFDIHQRRYILQQYLDFICDYKGAIGTDAHSFSTHVYNQQFKGSLELSRGYNAVRLSFPDLDRDDMLTIAQQAKEPPSKKVLKFDIPLYNRYTDQYQDWLHEELIADIPNDLWQGLKDKGRNKKPLKNDFYLELPKGNKKRYRGTNPDLARQLRYMTLNDTGPFYIGWDANLRKMVFKGSQLPVNMPSGDQLEIGLEDSSSDKSDKGWVHFDFQAWPVWPEQEDRAWVEKLNVPTLTVSQAQLEKLRTAIGYGEVEDNSEYEEEEMDDTKRIRLDMEKKEAQELLKRVANYDWFWRKLMLSEDPEDEKRSWVSYLNLGCTAPPKLDGYAWPSSGGDQRVSNDSD